MSGADLGSEDLKLVTLARAAQARSDAAEGAAVRDPTGRTYVAVSVTLPSMQLTAIQAAVAAAASSGAQGLEAAVLVSDVASMDDASVAAVRDLGGEGTALLLAGPSGAVVAMTTT